MKCTIEREWVNYKRVLQTRFESRNMGKTFGLLFFEDSSIRIWINIFENWWIRCHSSLEDRFLFNSSSTPSSLGEALFHREQILFLLSFVHRNWSRSSTWSSRPWRAMDSPLSSVLWNNIYLYIDIFIDVWYVWFVYITSLEFHNSRRVNSSSHFVETNQQNSRFYCWIMHDGLFFIFHNFFPPQ